MAISRFDQPAPYVQQYIPKLPELDMNTWMPVMQGLQTEWNKFEMLRDTPIPSTPGDLEMVNQYRKGIDEKIANTANIYHEQGVAGGRRSLTKDSLGVMREMSDPNSDIYKIMGQAKGLQAFEAEMKENEFTNPFDKKLIDATVKAQASASSFGEDGKFRPISYPMLLSQDINAFKLTTEALDHIKAVKGKHGHFAGFKFEFVTDSKGVERMVTEQGTYLEPKVLAQILEIAVSETRGIQEHLQFEDQQSRILKGMGYEEEGERRSYDNVLRRLVNGIANAAGYVSWEYSVYKDDAVQNKVLEADPYKDPMEGTYIWPYTGVGSTTPLASGRIDDFKQKVVNFRDQFTTPGSEFFPIDAITTKKDGKQIYTVDGQSIDVTGIYYTKGVPAIEKMSKIKGDTSEGSAWSQIETWKERDNTITQKILTQMQAKNPGVNPEILQRAAERFVTSVDNQIIGWNRTMAAGYRWLEEQLVDANREGNKEVAAIKRDQLDLDNITMKNFTDRPSFAIIGKEYLEKEIMGSYNYYSGNWIGAPRNEIEADFRLAHKSKQWKDGTKVDNENPFGQYLDKYPAKREELFDLTMSRLKDLSYGDDYGKDAFGRILDQNFADKVAFRFIPEGKEPTFSESEKGTKLQAIELDVMNKSNPNRSTDSKNPLQNIAKEMSTWNIISIDTKSNFVDKDGNRALMGSVLKQEELEKAGMQWGIEFKGFTLHNGRFMAVGYLLDKSLTQKELVVYDTNDGQLNDTLLDAYQMHSPAHMAYTIESMTEASRMDNSEKKAHWDATGLAGKDTPLEIRHNKEESLPYTIIARGQTASFKNSYEAAVHVNNLIARSDRGKGVVYGRPSYKISQEERVVNEKLFRNAVDNNITPEYTAYFPNYHKGKFNNEAEKASHMSKVLYAIGTIESDRTYAQDVQPIGKDGKAFSSAIGPLQNTLATLPPGVTPWEFAQWPIERQIMHNLSSWASSPLFTSIRDEYDWYMYHFRPALGRSPDWRNSDSRSKYTLEQLRKEINNEDTWSKNMFYKSWQQNPNMTVIDFLKPKFN